ncbi:hypothetical protein ACX27_29130 [Nostoc piscinale CENA21]|uniref:Uncharacterized protein n=1 Tax=Nostoc piscinale CENA21 TaxID=224013 RepID=A0A0M4U0M2_9NOSO|nr:hypothetical protein [Nostoc piscinale]ALF55989.1 hypothetical protein ACX27_29130 [Nostoc piscinale CENA21]
MLQITDLENNELFIQASSEELATVLGGITGVDLANIQDGIGNYSNSVRLFSLDGNKLFTIDLSRLTINLVAILPSGLPEVLSWTNGI